MAFSGSADDITAIRTLHDGYADAVFRRDAQDWGANWAEDARWFLGETEVSGRVAIITLWQQAMAGFSFVAFFSQTGSMTINGDTACGVVYTHEVLEQADGTLIRPVGRYEDHYVKAGGRWLYQERRYTLLKG